jgi:hypothetical protein
MSKKDCQAFVIILAAIFFSGCTKQYAYLNKVKANPKKGSFNLQVINESPQRLAKGAEKDIKDVCIKKLIRKGHPYTTKNPLYNFEIYIKVDTATTVHQSIIGPYIVRGGDRVYIRNTTAIYLHVNVLKKGNRFPYHEDFYDLYYFGEPKRDLKRTKGVAKYLMSKFEE